MVPSARKAALRMGLAECIARAAPPQALLSFRYKDGLVLDELLLATIGSQKRQSHGRGDPGQPGHESAKIETYMAIRPDSLRPSLKRPPPNNCQAWRVNLIPPRAHQCEVVIAGVAHLAERDLPKVEVAGSIPVSRSTFSISNRIRWYTRVSARRVGSGPELNEEQEAPQ
jgi:hypothetical protein